MSRILLVDDDPEVLNRVERDLRDLGECVKVGSAESALDILDRDSNVQLLVLDIRMAPGMMDGIEALRIIDDRHPTVGVVMLTSYGASSGLTENVKRARDSGMLSFVEKPYDPGHLKKVVRRCLHELSTPGHAEFIRRFWRGVRFVRNERGIEDDSRQEIEVHNGFLEVLKQEIEDVSKQTGLHGSLTLDMRYVTFVAEPGLALLMRLPEITRVTMRNLSPCVQREIEILCMGRLFLEKQDREYALRTHEDEQ